MRKLYLDNGNENFKFADTTTEIRLNAFDDGRLASLTADAKVRIKNGSGYLLEVSPSVTSNHAVITSGQLAQLPVGSYLIELWDTESGGTAIYPSDGFLTLQINENVTGLSGKLVSSITVDDFIQQFSDLSQQMKRKVSDALANPKIIPEVFANSTDLKNAYPKGKEGMFVTADMGHMWRFVNGNWADCGPYQFAGKFTVHSADLGDDVAAAFNVSGEYVNFDVIQGQYLSINTGELVQNGKTKVSSEIPVVEGEIYGVSAHTYYDGRAVTFLDANKKVVAGYPNENKDADFFARVAVPVGAKYMRVGGLSEIGGLNDGHINQCQLAVVKHVSLYPRNEISDDFLIKTNENFAPVDYAKMASAGYWNDMNGVFTENSHTACSKPVKVKAGEVYKISGYNFWDGRLWTLLDSNGHVMKAFDKSDDKKHTETLVIPNGACFLLINSQAKSVSTLERGFVNRNGVYRKMTVIGDSWTAKNTLNGQKNWTDYVSELLKKKGINLDVDNQAVGGTGYLANNGGSTDNFQTRSYDSSADVYTIFGSFNDAWSVHDFGSASSQTGGSLAAAVQATIDHVLATNIGAKIGIISPGPWQAFNPRATGAISGTSISNAADWAEKYVKTLKEMAEFNSIPFLDLYHTSQLKPWNSTFIATYYHGENPTDGTHPNTKGHEFFAPVIADFVSGLLE